jgi:hypothetical protein
MLDSDFLAKFKRSTEAKWSERSINPTLFGFQFQRGTRWNSGLSEEQIAEYEGVIAVTFPNDFGAFLRVMNGTDTPTVNVYGYCGEPHRQWVGVYSYPRDVEIVKQLMEDVHKSPAKLTTTLMEQGFDLLPETRLLPFYGHRYLVCTKNLEPSVVLSIDGSDDAIVYGNSLKEYLEREFLRDLPL